MTAMNDDPAALIGELESAGNEWIAFRNERAADLCYRAAVALAEQSQLRETAEAQAEELRNREWRNMPDDKPDTYNGHPQPGAAPYHYGPDDVVVDGDWLADLEQRYEFANSELEAAEQIAKVNYGLYKSAESDLSAAEAALATAREDAVDPIVKLLSRYEETEPEDVWRLVEDARSAAIRAADRPTEPSGYYAERRARDNSPCPKCGGDRLRTDFTGSGKCHAGFPVPVRVEPTTDDEGNRS